MLPVSAGVTGWPFLPTASQLPGRCNGPTLQVREPRLEEWAQRALTCKALVRKPGTQPRPLREGKPTGRALPHRRAPGALP